MKSSAVSHPPTDYDTRFSGIARLYSQAGLERLRAAHVCVVGIGGVGSWAAEALARSGVGKLSLVDMDEVCLSNVNRQLHAADGDIGKPKVSVMAHRVHGINPECEVIPHILYLTERNVDKLITGDMDFVIDAIDSVKHKCLMIARCREVGVPVIVSGGAGGLTSGARICVEDLARSHNDRLLQMVRKKLRSDYGFPKGEGKKFKIDCLFTPETPVFPQADGTVCATRPEGVEGNDLRLNCDSGFGTATYVTGAFGFAAAGHVVDRLTRAVRTGG